MMDISEQINKNKVLLQKYPFLKLSHIDDCSHTILDDMPKGWRIAFGEQMCEEIMNDLIKNGIDPKEYCVLQIKEKFGSLRWYDCGGTDRISEEIIPKYEKLSARTCIHCGEPATVITTAWISPFCDSCLSKIGTDTVHVDIKEWFKDDV